MSQGPTFPPFLLWQAVASSLTGGIFFGFYLISAAYANRWLIFTDDGWKLRKDIHWHTFAVTNMNFVMIVIVLALTVNTSIAEAAFVEGGHQLNEYKSAPWNAVVQCALSGVIILLADTVLMHRLWVTHMRQMAVMWLPIILWLGGIVCVCLQMFLQVKNIDDPDFGPYKWAKVNMQVGPGIVFLPFLASTIVLNAYCTGLLIWRIQKNVKNVGNNASSQRLQSLVLILMESGVLYLAMSIAHFIAYFGHSNFAVHMNGWLHTVVVGIAYDLIVIRVGQSRSESEYTLTNDKLTTFRVADMDHVSSLGFTNSISTGETMHVRGDKSVAI